MPRGDGLCGDFQRGECRRGSECRFAHKYTGARDSAMRANNAGSRKQQRHRGTDAADAPCDADAHGFRGDGSWGADGRYSNRYNGEKEMREIAPRAGFKGDGKSGDYQRGAWGEHTEAWRSKSRNNNLNRNGGKFRGSRKNNSPRRRSRSRSGSSSRSSSSSSSSSTSERRKSRRHRGRGRRRRRRRRSGSRPRRVPSKAAAIRSARTEFKKLQADVREIRERLAAATADLEKQGHERSIMCARKLEDTEKKVREQFFDSLAQMRKEFETTLPAEQDNAEIKLREEMGDTLKKLNAILDECNFRLREETEEKALELKQELKIDFEMKIEETRQQIVFDHEARLQAESKAMTEQLEAKIREIRDQADKDEAPADDREHDRLNSQLKDKEDKLASAKTRLEKLTGKPVVTDEGKRRLPFPSRFAATAGRTNRIRNRRELGRERGVVGCMQRRQLRAGGRRGRQLRLSDTNATPIGRTTGKAKLGNGKVSDTHRRHRRMSKRAGQSTRGNASKSRIAQRSPSGDDSRDHVGTGDDVNDAGNVDASSRGAAQKQIAQRLPDDADDINSHEASARNQSQALTHRDGNKFLDEERGCQSEHENGRAGDEDGADNIRWADI